MTSRRPPAALPRTAEANSAIPVITPPPVNGGQVVPSTRPATAAAKKRPSNDPAGSFITRPRRRLQDLLSAPLLDRAERTDALCLLRGTPIPLSRVVEHSGHRSAAQTVPTHVATCLSSAARTSATSRDGR